MWREVIKRQYGESMGGWYLGRVARGNGSFIWKDIFYLGQPGHFVDAKLSVAFVSPVMGVTLVYPFGNKR